jgi:dUTP pyrophosphatase
MEIPITRVHDDALLPTRAHPTDAGMDLYALEGVEIPPQQRVLVRTGIAAAVPPGFVALFWDRSGLAAKSGITTLAGVIDASYRGEWKVVLFNTTDGTYRVERGERVAQVLIQQVVLHTWKVVSRLPDGTERTRNGFGSTGR